ncbi:MAG: glycosyltransferase family 4 protein [Candidatus Eisenbacteria bacterium]|jgi:glycosyltransferase involved in cell wall biosynthesis|nr:glycosyltransferase family 4 protein [Candidatus Eisenbacteria bacterium]
MRVLLVNKHGFVRSGTERYLFSVKRALEDRGHAVETFTMAHPRNEPARFADLFPPEIDFRQLSSRQRWGVAGRVIWYREGARRMERVLDAFAPDIVHVFNIYHHLSPSILPPMTRRGIPVVQTLNDYKLICPNYLLFTDGRPCERCRGGRFWQAVAHRCLGTWSWSLLAAAEMTAHRTIGAFQGFARRLIAPTAFVRQKVIDFGLSPGQVTVIPYFAPVTPRLLEPEAGPYVLFAGRLSREKGLPILLRAMRLLPEVPLFVAGEGPVREDLERLSTELGLNNVRFLGHLAGDRLGRTIAGCRLTVLPSIWYEVFGISILESWVAGKPVVASGIGGIPDVVKDGVDGVLVPPGDPAALATAIRRLWSAPQEAEDMGRAGRKRVIETFSTETHISRLLDAYAALA